MTQVDRLFSDRDLAGVYDAFNPWDRRADFPFYLPLVMSARSVLDVGCGTGALLQRARRDGHTGRLCGLDPAVGMLAQARKRPDIEWVRGDLAALAADDKFDLVVMTGHAFQVFVEDHELRTSLAAIRAALGGDGRFAFETRNPLVREWDHWQARSARETSDASGNPVSMATEVEAVEGELVRFSHTFTSPAWGEPRHSRSTLRFLGAESLARFLSDAGLSIEAQFGDWGREPLRDTSPEIITIARL